MKADCGFSFIFIFFMCFSTISKADETLDLKNAKYLIFR